ncbi:MAG: hypothetical protein HQK54_16565 [Oligoflexales bacterium]|nr:hypothetical protein [Oligoflexales bacterium]
MPINQLFKSYIKYFFIALTILVLIGCEKKEKSSDSDANSTQVTSGDEKVPDSPSIDQNVAESQKPFHQSPVIIDDPLTLFKEFIAKWDGSGDMDNEKWQIVDRKE